MHTFTRQQRLLTPAQFQHVFSHRKIRIYQGPFMLIAISNGSSTSRLGLVIGKKKAKRAVDRNAMKRRIREQFRQRQHQFNNIDIVVVATKAINRDDLRDMTAILSSAMDKLLAKTRQD